MPLSHEHVGSKILAKIKIYILTRAELLINLCYEIPCRLGQSLRTKIQSRSLWVSSGQGQVLEYSLCKNTNEGIVHNFSHLSNKRGGWNKRRGGAKNAKSKNMEVEVLQLESSSFLFRQLISKLLFRLRRLWFPSASASASASVRKNFLMVAHIKRC